MTDQPALCECLFPAEVPHRHAVDSTGTVVPVVYGWYKDGDTWKSVDDFPGAVLPDDEDEIVPTFEEWAERFDNPDFPADDPVDEDAWLDDVRRAREDSDPAPGPGRIVGYIELDE